MGIFRRLREAFQPPDQSAADPQAGLETVRQALEAEALRLNRRSRLSLTMLMEFSDADLTAVDLHATLGYLQAQGEILNVQDDSFGNLRFDLADPPSRAPTT